MTSDAEKTSNQLSAHPRRRAMESWTAELSVPDRCGEIDGPRVDECCATLSFYRLRTVLILEVIMSSERADALVDQFLHGSEAPS